VTTGELTAEVAHEALIREWPTLHGWLSEDREGLRTHRQITEAADQWEAMERDPGALYRGTRLARVMDWAAGHPEMLYDRETAFVAESDAQARREVTEREQQHRRELEAAERSRGRAASEQGQLGRRLAVERRSSGRSARGGARVVALSRPAGPRQPGKATASDRGGGDGIPRAKAPSRGATGDPGHPGAVHAPGGRGPAACFAPAVQRSDHHLAAAGRRILRLGGRTLPARGFR
jgi:hypothetical protein